MRVRTADPVWPLRVAVIVAVESTDTLLVVTVNVAVVAPAATVTEAGTVALALFDDSETVAPPAGAAVASVIVPVDGEPPLTVVGLRETERAATVTVRVAFAV